MKKSFDMPGMPKIECVIFDLDGTLFDRDRSLRDFLAHQWRNWRSLQTVTVEKFSRKFIELDRNGSVWKDEVYAGLVSGLGIQDIDPKLLLRHYLAEFRNHACLFPGALEVLRGLRLHQIRPGIITNGRADLQSSVIAACGLDELVDVILISEAEGIQKPDPRIFERASERLGATPAACVFVGDSAEADVRGAHGAGMKTIWKRNDGCEEPGIEITSAVFERFEELPTIFRALGGTS